MSTLPLAGLRILDLGTRIAAPFAATLLGDFGAEVIKVELPGSGDFMRSIGPFVGDYSLWWAVEGRNKKSITLDLRTPRGQALLKQLIAVSDVAVENFQPGTLEGWNLGFDTLRAINPNLILARASVYGQSGPYRDRPGLDRNGIGFGGLLYLTGYRDRPPVRPGVIISDYLTAVFNAFAIMMALYHRDVHRGGGQSIDVALYESIFRILEHTMTSYDRLGVVREREGNRLRNSAPLDNWETKDGEFVCIVAAGDGLFPRLARALGREDLLTDARFGSLSARVAHADEINGIVGEWVKRHTAAEIEAILIPAQVPVTRAYSIADIAADPHYAAREDIVTVDDPTIGPLRMQAVYPRLSETPGRIARGAPKLGEHNHEVYADLLGLSDGEIAALRADGVI
ncbi:MAG: CoA transferase [Deltaproteobacteria bacterium]|nr:CoA transferase [Deltaproteobacteria bacterium]MBI3388837.1 CoA transferase [Deltaproteobacteria bacterium]